MPRVIARRQIKATSLRGGNLYNKKKKLAELLRQSTKDHPNKFLGPEDCKSDCHLNNSTIEIEGNLRFKTYAFLLFLIPPPTPPTGAIYNRRRCPNWPKKV